MPAPITNVSKVYLTLNDRGALALSTESAASAAPLPDPTGAPTLTTSELFRPITESSTSSRSGLKRLSMYSFANVFGTEISSRSSLTSTGRMPSNQTLSDETSICSDARSNTSAHT